MSSYSAYWSQGNYQPQQQNQTFMSKTGPDYRTPTRSPNMGQQAVAGGASQYRTPGIMDAYNSRTKRGGLSGPSGLDTLPSPQYNGSYVAPDTREQIMQQFPGVGAYASQSPRSPVLSTAGESEGGYGDIVKQPAPSFQPQEGLSFAQWNTLVGGGGGFDVGGSRQTAYRKFLMKNPQYGKIGNNAPSSPYLK